MTTSNTGINIIRIEETTSTNDEARKAEYAHGDLIVAERQTRGRGQRGNSWSSGEGQNLTFSLVVEPVFLPADRQFLLSEAVALAVTDTLAASGIEAQVKWPNDIYIGGRKTAGILIENDICGATLSRSIIGIGLNVNQIEFDTALSNPTSMRIAAGREFDREEVLACFCRSFAARYCALAEGAVRELQSDYHRRLYLLGESHTYKLPDGTPLSGTIREVRATGELIVETADGDTRSFLFKEIEF